MKENEILLVSMGSSLELQNQIKSMFYVYGSEMSDLGVTYFKNGGQAILRGLPLKIVRPASSKTSRFLLFWYFFVIILLDIATVYLYIGVNFFELILLLKA